MRNETDILEVLEQHRALMAHVGTDPRHCDIAQMHHFAGFVRGIARASHGELFGLLLAIAYATTDMARELERAAP